MLEILIPYIRKTAKKSYDKARFNSLFRPGNNKGFIFSYCLGFSSGLAKKFAEEKKTMTGTELMVLNTPKQVQNAYDELDIPKNQVEMCIENNEGFEEGHKEGEIYGIKIEEVVD